MTRENMEQIIEKYDLFQDMHERLTLSDQIGMMYDKIQVVRYVDPSLPEYNQAATAFQVSFEDYSPDIAFAVASELITLFLSENVRSRTALASETTDFFRGEGAKLKEQLEAIEQRLADYKQLNSRALPEHLGLHMTMRDRTERAIENVDRDINTAEDDYRFLEIELAAVRSGVGNTSGQQSVQTPEQRLRAAEAELSLLESKYSSRHPDVKRQKSTIERLRAEIDKGQGSSLLASENIEVIRVRTALTSAQDRIDSLKNQKQRLEEERTELESVIKQTPQVQRDLIGLNRDYDNMLEKYNEMQSRQMEAQLTKSLELEEKAERFSLLEPPVLSARPIRPDRKKIATMGLAFAFAASIGLVLLMETLDQRIYNVDSLAEILDEEPFAIIPVIATQAETDGKRRYQRIVMSGCAVSVAVVFCLLHFFYMPLDILAMKFMAKLG